VEDQPSGLSSAQRSFNGMVTTPNVGRREYGESRPASSSRESHRNGMESLRGYVERNSIALLSNYQKPPLDPASPVWLGQRCDRERVLLLPDKRDPRRKNVFYNLGQVPRAAGCVLRRFDTTKKNQLAI
jgi:hypothetical protein